MSSRPAADRPPSSGDSVGARGAGRGPARRDRAGGAGRLPAGRHTLTRAQVTSSQRQRLLDAMAVLCAADGYPAATIAEVVERAGVSRATFYVLFGDKEECLIATLDEALRLMKAAIMPIADEPRADEWPAQVRDVIAALLDFLVAEPEYARTAMIEAGVVGGRAHERYTAGTELIVSLIDRGREHMPADVATPARTARAVFGGCETLIVDELIARRASRIPAMLPDLLYLVLAPYLGQAGAVREAELLAAP